MTLSDFRDGTCVQLPDGVVLHAERFAQDSYFLRDAAGVVRYLAGPGDFGLRRATPEPEGAARLYVSRCELTIDDLTAVE